jgi:alkanesulfonate monooxygenase SsuD/methylene tetrahydromethanopterin reductase-like flavin-dependent oxidoreductase (luciferase family)
VTYRGRTFSADQVALEFAAPRPDMPMHLAAMADRSLAPAGAEATEIAKEAVGAMLIPLWPTGNDWPAPRETIVRLSGIARPEMVGALDRLRRSEWARRVLDHRFISDFAFAGTAEQVIAQAARYRRAGADELALSFAGPQPAADAAHFARAVKRLIPDGELAIDLRRSPPDIG